MNSSKLIIVGVIWFGLVVLWLFFGPREFFVDFGPAFGLKRSLIKIATYGIGLFYSVFMFGWLEPLSTGHLSHL